MPPRRRFQPPTPDSFAPSAPPVPPPSTARRRPNARPTFDSFMSPSTQTLLQQNTINSPTPLNAHQKARRKPAKRLLLDPDFVNIKKEEKDPEEDVILPSEHPEEEEQDAQNPDHPWKDDQKNIILATDNPSPDEHEDAILPGTSPIRDPSVIPLGPFTPQRARRGHCILDAIQVPDSSPLQFKTPQKQNRQLHNIRTPRGGMRDEIASPSQMSSPFHFPTPRAQRGREESHFSDDEDLPTPATPSRFRPPRIPPLKTPIRPTATHSDDEDLHTSPTTPRPKRRRLSPIEIEHDSIEESQDALATIKLESTGPSEDLEEEVEESQDTTGLLTDPLSPSTTRTYHTPFRTPFRFTAPPLTRPKATPQPALRPKPQNKEPPVRIIRILALGDPFPDGGRLVHGFFEHGARNDEERRGGAMILSREGGVGTQAVRVGGRVGLFGVGWRVVPKVGVWWKIRGRWGVLRDEEEVKGEEGVEEGVEMPDVERGYYLGEVKEEEKEVGEDLPEEVREEEDDEVGMDLPEARQDDEVMGEIHQEQLKRSSSNEVL